MPAEFSAIINECLNGLDWVGIYFGSDGLICTCMSADWVGLLKMDTERTVFVHKSGDNCSGAR